MLIRVHLYRLWYKNVANSKEYNAEYYAKNRERIVAHRKAIRETVEFKEQSKAYHAQYHKENPHKTRERRRRRRALIKSQPSEKYTEKQVLDLYGTCCHICGVEINLKISRIAGKEEGWEMGLHIDHLIPVSNGGPDTLDNVRPTHAVCNLQKHTKPIQLVTQEKG